MKLEGTVKQIRLQCPRKMTDLEVKQHLKDCLFHGVQKHIQDSVQYLYSTPRTSYLEVMVTAHKAESNNEEFLDKVRARAMVGTDSGEGVAEVGQQIARSMAALTKDVQGGNPSSTPSTPWERSFGRGCNGSSTPNHPNSHDSRSGPGQTTPVHSLPTGCWTGSQGTGNNGQSNQGLAQGGRAQLIGGTQIPSNGLGARGWAPASSRPTHSHPNYGQRPTCMKAARQTGPRETAPAIPFLNPDAVAHLVGQ